MNSIDNVINELSEDEVKILHRFASDTDKQPSRTKLLRATGLTSRKIDTALNTLEVLEVVISHRTFTAKPGRNPVSYQLTKLGQKVVKSLTKKRVIGAS